MSMGAAAYRSRTTQRQRATREDPEDESTTPTSAAYSSLVIGAKTLAGVGIGLLAVTGGVLVVGAIAEAIVVPSLLLKLAGGLTGGGMGMARGLKAARKDAEE